MCDINPEAVDAEVEPEPQRALEVGSNVVIFPVEIGLLGREEVQVPLTGRSVGRGCPRPRQAAESTLPVIGWLVAVLATPAPKNVAISLRRTWGGLQRIAEPRVLVRRVIGNDVKQHT